ERREADPSPDPPADRGAAQGARAGRPPLRRGREGRDPQRPPRRHAPPRGARPKGRRRRRRGAPRREPGAEAHRRAHEVDRRAPEAQRARNHGGVNLLTRIRTLRHVRPAPEPPRPEVARAVAIVMDGNGRWARRRGLPIAAGHRAGTRALRRTVEAAIDLGVDSLTVYAFSTENWTPPAEEVEALM